MDSVSRLICCLLLGLLAVGAHAHGVVAGTGGQQGQIAPEGFCALGSCTYAGGAGAGSVSGSGYTEAANAHKARLIADWNSAHPTHPLIMDGGMSFADANPSVSWAQAAHWMNGEFPVSNDLGGNLTPYCAVYQGARPIPTHTGTLTWMCTGALPTSCPANSTLTSGSCICNAGYQPNAGATACIAVPACSTVAASLNASSAVLYAQGAGLGLGACYGGCVMVGSIAGADSSGRYVAGPFTATGANCNGSNPTNGNDGTPPADKPKPGNCPGTVNGVSVPGGVPCSGGQQGAGPTDTKGPDSTASSPVGTTPGTSGSTGSTTCKDGLCTTTTTTTTNNSNGTSTTGSGSTTQTQDEFCAKNPGNPMCKDAEGSFGGSCSAGFACEGDAVQCAMAREQFQRNCATLDAAPAGDPAVQAAGAGDQPGWHPAKNGASVSLGGGFDQTNIVSGSCPADQTIQVSHFTPVVIAFSKLCQPAEWLGNILVGLTALACLGIVFVRGS